MSVRAIGILASAGTGKTYRLTGELLGLLLGGCPAESLFAATFTRTAAAEILERVLRRLCDAATSAKGLDELRRALGRPDLTAEQCRSCAATVGRSLDRLAVWTLDAFLVRAATAFSVEIGLAPGWRVVEDDEDAAMRRAAVARVLREAGMPVILPLLRMLKKSEGERSVHESIFSVVNSLHDVHVQAIDGAWNTVAPCGEPVEEQALAALLDQFAAAKGPPTRSGPPNKVWTKAILKAAELARASEWDKFLDSTLVSSVSLKGIFNGAGAPEELLLLCRKLAAHARAAVVELLRNQNTAAVELVKRFDSAYGELKRSLGSVRFDDLPRLLGGRSAERIRDELYYRLDARIEHVLLDEFQDTSVAQFRVVEPMIAELISDETRRRSFFYVGDAKQSLFGWRHAEPTLLGHLQKRWPHIQVEPLATSFRSSPPIIAAVNTVFSGLARCPCLQDDAGRAAAREFSELFHEHSCDRSVAGNPGRVLVREFPEVDEDETSDTTPDDRCEFVADRIAEIARRSPHASIGVLLRTKNWVPRLLMSIQHRGFDAAEEGGSPLVQSPAVAAVVSLLHLADHPGDRMAAFHVATTALGGLVRLDRRVDPDAVAAVSRHVRDDLARRGAGAVVGDWARWLAPVCSELDRTRLSQAVEIAETYGARGSASVRGLIEMIELARRSAGTPARIRVMTIHAAKGLEFDAVIAPELDGRVPSRPPEVLYERDDLLGPITRVSLNASKAVCSAGGIIAEMATRRLQREIREALCLLYVTMTRPRRYLEMIVRPQNSGESFRLSRVVCAALRMADQAQGQEAADDEPADREGRLLYVSGDDDWDRGIKAEPVSVKEKAPPMRVGLAATRAVSRSASDIGDNPRVAEEGEDPSLIRVHEPVVAGDIGPASSLFLAAAPRSQAPAAVRRAARGLGTAVHACLESVGWVDDGLPTDEHLIASLDGVRLPFELSEREVVTVVRRVLSTPAVAQVFSRGRYRAQGRGAEFQLFRELAGAGIVDQDGSLTRGRIDRLVIVRQDGTPVEAEVIDWKTDGLGAGGARGQMPGAVNTDHYRGQLERYARIVAKALGIQRASVRATVVFVATGTVHTYAP
ncbi:MAG: RecBCD enzyme subunit RecB [Phycisphaerales bacterium]|nr:RecBCD enzyme subunit RecB [Phycisphaerales bacterium]